jgi:NAD(P)H-flavin reductase
MGVRISTSPLTEWHSFATVQAPEKGGYYVTVSRAGDWTSKQIDDPPTKIWVRGIPIRGMLSVATLFRRVLFVTTGSGIAPVRSCLPAIKVPFRLLWTCPNARETYGDVYVNDILEASPDTVIYSTSLACFHGPQLITQTANKQIREPMVNRT